MTPVTFSCNGCYSIRNIDERSPVMDRCTTCNPTKEVNMTTKSIDQRVEDIREVLGILEAQINTIAGEIEAPTTMSDAELLVQAISHQTPVSFDYCKRGQSLLDAERRVVSLYEVEGEDEDVVRILGYDHTRDGIRRFRIDRMVSTIAAEPQVPFRAPVE